MGARVPSASFERQFDSKRRARSGVAFYNDLSIMRFDDPAADRQAKAGASVLSGTGLVYAVEALENVRQLALRDSDSIVFYMAHGDSVVMADGREVSLASVRVGMPALAEIDDAGRLIVLDVKGVVE